MVLVPRSPRFATGFGNRRLEPNEEFSFWRSWEGIAVTLQPCPELQVKIISPIHDQSYPYIFVLFLTLFIAFNKEHSSLVKVMVNHNDLILGGADAAYIHEERFTVRDIMNDLDMLKSKMELGKIQRGLIMRNEKANSEYTTEFLYSMFAEEGRDFFSVRKNVLGHMQQVC